MEGSQWLRHEKQSWVASSACLISFLVFTTTLSPISSVTSFSSQDGKCIFKLCSELKENPGKLVAWQVFWWRINRAASLRASTENPSLKIIRSISKIERNVLCEWYVWGFRLFGLPEHKSEVFPRRVSHSSVPNAPLGFCLLEPLSAEIFKGIRWRFISAWMLRQAWHSGKGGCARLCAEWVWVVKLGCKH